MEGDPKKGSSRRTLASVFSATKQEKDVNLHLGLGIGPGHDDDANGLNGNGAKWAFYFNM